VKTTLAEALFLCRNKCQNDIPVFTVFVLRFSRALSDHCFLPLSYCARLAPPLDCFDLFKDVNHLDYALAFTCAFFKLALKLTSIVDEQVEFLYDVYVSLRNKLFPDTSPSWMSLGLCKSIRWRDALKYQNSGFRDVRTAVARLAEKEFNPVTRLIWG
jgi:hypothetical protein